MVALSGHSARQLEQVGLLVQGVGALLLVAGGFFGVQRVRTGHGNPMHERSLMAAAGLVLGFGILLQLIGVHAV